VRSLVARGLCCCVVAALPAAAEASTPNRPGAGCAVPCVAARAAADSVARARIDIPAQPLAGALRDFARQAGVRVTFDSAATAGVQSPGVVGTFAPAEALRRLLAGTGFTGRFADPQHVVVSRAGERESTVERLGPIVVTAAASRRTAYAAPRTMTATKTDTPLRDTPQAVTVVTRELIADQAMQGMGDVVRYVPGITMGQGEGHRDQPTIRGNASTADFFVDGVRDDAQYFRDLYNVERVEALKGSNAMIFGRGGGGGVINRVSKEAQWIPTGALTVEGGSFDHKRASLDVGQGLAPAAAARVNALYEDSQGFRDAAHLERYGVNPTVALAAGGNTFVRLGYELFDDRRTVDRGIPSFRGRPSSAGVTTFFGDPDVSHASARVHAAGASVEHGTAAGLTIRNRTRFVHYEKFYQNVFPGAVNAAGTQVSLSAYNNSHTRTNLFNQTDLTYGLNTGSVRHTLLLGAELGRQATDNFRNTGYLDGGATSTSVPFDRPTVSLPVTFRQSATDADNHVTANVAAVYAQNQIALSPQWQAILGLRYDRFDLRFHDDRKGQELRRDDRLLSPRAGLVYKPVEPLSVYGAYGLSYLPSAGDQFSSLTATTQTLKPERFTNYELGAKWDVRPDLSLTTAAYRLDRTNSSAPDPADPARTVQTGSQRTTGYELGATGNLTRAWQVAGGWASQRATIRSATTAAKPGATVPLVPHHTLSLWNRYQVARALAAGVGVVHQARVYAAVDNSVTLPSFTRVDGALFVTLNSHLRAQLNVENLLDRRYYPSSQGNNNIMPGASRTVRLSLVTGL
jgi:catecholate siderophore receptor